MTTRDRTRLFISYRQSCVHHPVTCSVNEEKKRLLGMQTNIEMDCLPPDWSGTIDDVEELLADIQTDYEVLDRLYRKNMLPGFDDRRKDEGEIERLSMYTTQRFRKCQDLIKTVIPRSNATRAEVEIAKNVQIALANKVQAENMIFRKKQSAYLRQLCGTYQNIPLALQDTSAFQNVDSSGMMLESSLALSNDTEIASRTREIADITKRILELSDIFKEIQSMVTDQGSVLHYINVHIDNATTHVDNASKELSHAEVYQKKTKKRKLILLLIIVVVGLFIIFSIKFSR